MQGVIVSFRRGRETQYGNQMIIHITGITSRDKALALVGKNVSWKTPSGKVISGMVRHAHGNKGCVRAFFERGMPGQSLGTVIEVVA